MSSCISSKSLVFLFVLYFSFNGLSPLCCFFLATRPICTRERVHKRCITELQISFWVNWVFMQPDYPQLCTCKINCIFLSFQPVFFVGTKNVRHVFLIECSHREFARIYLFTHIVCLSRASN